MTIQHPFARYLFRRFFVLLLSLVIATPILFILLRIIPGDPSNALLPVGATQEQIDAARHSLGTDVSLISQFFTWIHHLVTFSFGKSLISEASVGSEILQKLVVTVPLTLISFTIAIFVALVSGYVIAFRSRSWYGRLLNNVSQFGIAIPVFWVGLLLIYVFSLRNRIFPAGGFPSEGWHDFPNAVKSLVLPCLTIVLVMSSSLTRYVRSATLDVLDSDYIRTSRALGFSITGSIWRHAIRNAAAPLISILAIELSTTFVGAVVVERVFALPGLGSMLVTGISEHDFPVIQGILFLSTVGVMFVGFFADALQKFLDPRLNRYSQGAIN
ncbi:MAG: ABC transporter permease [Actinomycetota bacterium]